MISCFRALVSVVPVVAALLPSGLSAQDTLQRLEKLERENEELRRRLDILAEEQERLELGDLVPPVGEGQYGLGPAASKVYSIQSGLSIGGYGEAIYRNFAGGTDEFDFLRAVLYFGYKFNEHWVFNSELEFEHASTSGAGSASVEFAYIDYLRSDEISARVGLVLVPMGLVNELHEPSTYLCANRPETELRILPTTWRENGIGTFGELGDISYCAYAVNGFDGKDFQATGLRGGRQKGSEALAEDFALVVRADWTGKPGLLAGGSAYMGDAGQGQSSLGLGDTPVSIYELHAEWKAGGIWLRGLGAMARVGDVSQLNTSNGFTGDESVGEELHGFYFEGGYDVLSLLVPDSEASLSPYVRFESIDTQAEVPAGFASDPANDFDVLTFGIQYQPITELVFKIDYADYDRGGLDGLSLAVGYVF
ncbi:MAG: hypothetical protein CMJ89_11890 [Planctomycetes bacterium]|jgi:hypothetical protein|nr:hypothetical protein [Planctomycetota bacterium]